MVISTPLERLLAHCGFNETLQGYRDTSPQRIADLLSAFSRIPYENLSKIVRFADSSISNCRETPEQLIDGFIQHGSGGTCFSLTYALVSFLRELGYEAYPILADRRYGADTHCALVCRLSSARWELLDPGYRIYTPCPIPTSGTVRYELFLSSVELRALHSSRVELYSSTLDSLSASAPTVRYRLTYTCEPVDEERFCRAWERSFSWDMMRYPIVSAITKDSIVYVQKDSLRIYSPQGTLRVTLTDEQAVDELSQRVSISRALIKRALEIL